MNQNKKQIVNQISKSNSIFYHGHIQKNIQKLDERKDKFVYHRIQFLKQFCQPIKDKIQFVKQEIIRYQIMRDTQQQVIQNQKQIKSLKNQIAQYLHTQNYFKEKLNSYEQRSLELQVINQQLRKTISKIKNGILRHKQQVGFNLPPLIQKRLKTINNQQEMIKKVKSLSLNQSIQIQSQQIYKSHISKQNKRKKHNYSILNQSAIVDIKSQQNSQQKELKNIIPHNIQNIRNNIAQFNRFQSLFHQCFQHKKNNVQKYVSQLQSKLITNRQQFLKTCNAISNKQKIQFLIFNKLTVDEIITLFISFSWLNSKLNRNFQQKRKSIMQFAVKLPKIK